MPESQSVGPFDRFPEEVAEDLDGLVFLGHLEQEIDFCGHTFTIRTLKAHEELQVYRLLKDYQETFGQPLALAAATVCMCVTSVDHVENFCDPIGPSAKSYADSRFNWVISNWYRPVIEFLYAENRELVARQVAVVEAMRDLSLRSRQLSQVLYDSSIDQDDSPKPTPEILDLVPD